MCDQRDITTHNSFQHILLLFTEITTLTQPAPDWCQPWCTHVRIHMHACMCVHVWRCIWMLFCPAELSSVGLIIVVISLGTSRETQEMGSPWKSHDGWRSADVLVPASRLSPAQEQPLGKKEPGCCNQPVKDWRAQVRLLWDGGLE